MSGKTEPHEAGEQTIELLLPGHRGPYAVNDFREVESRAAEKEIVDYLYRAACPLVRCKPSSLSLRLSGDAPRDREAERITAKAYRDMLLEWSDDARSSALRMVPQILGLVALGATILVVVHFLEAEEQGTALGAMGSVLQVGGWVAMWTAISALFTAVTGYWRRARTLRRLAERPIRFVYADVEPHERFDHPPGSLAPLMVSEANGG